MFVDLPQNLILIWLSYPVIKLFHELGHGFAVKHWGGEVHEMGLMFLVFVPVPYVDASSSAAFHEKRRRAIVGASGILVEALLASMAMFVWINAEEGLLRAFAFNVMIIGGVSTDSNAFLLKNERLRLGRRIIDPVYD